MTSLSNLVLNREHSRMVDQIAIRDFGMSGLVLMENAGRGCAQHLLNQEINGVVLICCGAGNNGGDGLVIARHLANAVVDVQVLIAATPDNLSSDMLSNYRILAKTKIRMDCLPNSSDDEIRRRFQMTSGKKIAWVVDALLGTGAQGPVRPPLENWIRNINASNAKVLAVDVPSGVDCDTGQVNGIAVQATETCTFVALKPCFARDPGRRLSGKVSVIDIGIPKEIKFAVERLQSSGEVVDFAPEHSENSLSE